MGLGSELGFKTKLLAITKSTKQVFFKMDVFKVQHGYKWL